MNCEKCGKPSVYHSTLIVNGVGRTTNLCRDCAIKEGVFNSQATSLFDEFLSPFMHFLPFEEVADLTCPVCKTSLREFKSTGLLGCPNCYETFRREVQNVVERIAPNLTHKPDKIKKTSKKQTKEEKIAEMRAEMAQAVKEERYEDAAKIKKQIAKLEAENE